MNLISKRMNYNTFQESCKICLEEVKISDYPDVIKPCACNQFIHRKCLDRQLVKSKQDSCEVCKKKYIFNLYRNDTYIPINVVDEDVLIARTNDRAGLNICIVIIGSFMLVAFAGSILMLIDAINH